MPKRLIFVSVVSFLIVVQVTNANAADCRLREAGEKVRVPKGAQLQKHGYLCVDHRGTYVQIEGEREVLLPSRQVASYAPIARIQARPVDRMNELLDAGIAYPAPELNQEKQIVQHNPAGRPGI